MDQPSPTFAVIFRTHFNDDFAQRQLTKLAKWSSGGDLFTLVDETRGPVTNFNGADKFSITDQEILDAGFVEAGEGSIQWFSGDVPLYMFRKAHPNYDYYLQVEYDVDLNHEAAQLIARIAADQADVIALTKGEPVGDWHWLRSCLGAYRIEEVKHQLICASVFSGRALDLLAEKRLAQAADYKAGKVTSWPMCEGFIPSEAAKNGLKLEELSRYGSTANYDFWPPFLEQDAANFSGFLHPVLDRDRYTTSMLKFPERVKVSDMVLPTSWFHRKLQRTGIANYARVLFAPAFRRGLKVAFNQRMASS